MAVDEDELLQQALAMSMASEPMETGSAAPAEAEQAAPAGSSMFDSYDEELQNAIRMSMSEVQPGEGAAPAPSPVSLCLLPQQIYTCAFFSPFLQREGPLQADECSY